MQSTRSRTVTGTGPAGGGRRLVRAGAVAVLTGSLVACLGTAPAGAAPGPATAPSTVAVAAAPIPPGQEIFERFAGGVSSLRPDQLPLPLNDPGIQDHMRAAINPPPPPSGKPDPRFDPVRCGTAVLTFVAEYALPAGKVLRIIKEFGGIKAFAEITYRFMRAGTLPANATQELSELLASLTGVPGLVASCS